MPSLIVVRHDGSEQTIEARAGSSVMEVIRDAGVHELLALCGGCMSCATCHVYVDESFIDKLPVMSPEEHEMLDAATHRKPTSRLSCQIPFTDDLDGMRVVIAPEE